MHVACEAAAHIGRGGAELEAPGFNLDASSDIGLSEPLNLNFKFH